jgi:hypothetical protein
MHKFLMPICLLKPKHQDKFFKKYEDAKQLIEEFACKLVCLTKAFITTVSFTFSWTSLLSAAFEFAVSMSGIGGGGTGILLFSEVIALYRFGSDDSEDFFFAKFNKKIEFIIFISFNILLVALLIYCM